MAGPGLPAPVAVFRYRVLTGDGFSGEISSRTTQPDVAGLAGRVGCLMISIKNRLFTSALIDSYCRYVTQHLLAGYVTVVDRPYIHNVAAMAPGAPLNDDRVAGIRRLADDRTRQARRLIQKYNGQQISFVPWDDLSAQTPGWMISEIRTAFEARGAWHAALLEQARQHVGGPIDRDGLERWSQFLIEETPVLLYCYYAFCGGVVDFYPGELADHLWRLERGDFADELPRTTELATAHTGLVYVDIRDTRHGARRRR